MTSIILQHLICFSVISHSDCTPPIPVNVPDPVIVSEEIKEIEKTAIKLAEQGDLSGALSNLDRVTQMAPYYPSGFNNRAQVHVHVYSIA